MFKQGHSLGRQLAKFIPEIKQLCQEFSGVNVWFMGRDMDVFYLALKDEYKNVRYLVGLNRENARHLDHRHLLEKWLRSIGVKDGDVLIDSGFRGSIFERINGTKLKLNYFLLSARSDSFCAPINKELSEKYRTAILALEHSPKKEICSWDIKNRRPKVIKIGGQERIKIDRFYAGCIAALRGEPM